MHLCKLRLYNFRGYEDATFEFSPGVNHIYGSNAVGKTTILEAIQLLICGRSFRTQQASDMIRHGAANYVVEATFIKHGVEQGIKIAFDGKIKKILINQSPCLSYSNLLGVIYGVVFTPDDASLIKGVPSGRRHFLDLHIAQSDPLYVHHLSRYNKAMKQRNCLLRGKNVKAIVPWEIEMANAAEYIVEKRKIVVDSIANYACCSYKKLSEESSSLHVSLKTSVDKGKNGFLQVLEKSRSREMELGYTINGPHKDDLSFAIGNKEVRYFGSEGQQRSCVASLRLSSWDRLADQVGVSPLMLVDDVGISLDEIRKGKLHEKLCSMGQVLLTSTEKPSSGLIRSTDQVIAL
ncbi:MAG: DNA replication/repair protein RecF [Chlamydiota bacterium]|nr:DNA replication/repair protein RecF [Chlamydiota bacterium]